MKIYIHALTFILLFSIVTGSATAATHVSDDSIDPHAGAIIWSKAGSPYILDTDAFFYPGTAVTIDAGVSIFASTNTPTPKSLYINGPLIINGAKDQPVSASGIKSITVSHANALVNSFHMESSEGIEFNHATATIISSIFSGALQGNGISARASILNIRLSTIKNNAYGIYSYYLPPTPFLVRGVMADFGGLGNAAGEDPLQNHISIASSSIFGNSSYGIYNQTANTIQARENWWGSSAGPGTSVFGPVDAAPWLPKDPDVEECCSNVLFIPGFEASRLYLDEKNTFGRFTSTSTNTLWEPNRNDDVKKLLMDPSGKSVNNSVYTKDVIDSVFGFGVYKNFIAMMDGLVAVRTINAWHAYPYDWRYSVDTFVSGSDTLLKKTLSLASTSKTGKVSIVAHSNGGLLAKTLIKKLNDSGAGNLVDKVIFVAVPELGTPQAIPGLLHGDKQSILGGLVLNQNTARDMGEYSPGAYGLLPSSAYFSSILHVAAPIISFASSTLAGFNFSADIPNIQTLSSYDAVRAFLTGSSDHRSKPASSNIHFPIPLSSLFIDSAKKIHDTIDAIDFSPSTRVISLIGWGNTTLSGIHYIEEKDCHGPTLANRALSAQCVSSLGYVASTTYFGDGTVMGISAKTPTTSSRSLAASKNYYFDLRSQNAGKIFKDDHSTILNTDSGVGFVKQQILSTQASLPPYISDKEPTEADIRDDELIVTVHSPVELHMYDSQGRHTGIIKNPDPTSDLQRYETGIPGSDYHPSEGNTYISVPYGTDYKIMLKGIGTGSFSIDAVHNVNNHDISRDAFVSMPVTPLLEAELVLSTSTHSVSPTLFFDFDGNGTVDASTSPRDDYDENLNFKSIRTVVASLEQDTKKRTEWLKKFDTICDRIRKGIPLKYNTKKEEKFDKIEDEHWHMKNMDSSKHDRLLRMYRSVITAIDID
jgi:pimeloyl-ACP methyl ester carboxylesterase